MVFGFHENTTYMFFFSGCIQRNYQNALLEEIVYHFLKTKKNETWTWNWNNTFFFFFFFLSFSYMPYILGE